MNDHPRPGTPKWFLAIIAISVLLIAGIYAWDNTREDRESGGSEIGTRCSYEADGSIDC